MTSRLKPIQLVWFIVISNILVTAAVIVLAVRSWRLQQGQHLPSNVRTPCVTVMAIFLVAGFLGEWLLARGIRSVRWSNALLASARALVVHPVAKVLPGSLMIFAILYFIASPINGLNSFVILMCLPSSLYRLSMTLEVKKAEFTSSELSGSALYPAKPIRSSQWGN